MKRIRTKTPEQKAAFAAYMRRWNAANRERVLAQKRERYERDREAICLRRRQNRGTQRWCHIKRRYGLDAATIAGLLKIQDGKCKICSREPALGKQLYIDHDHDNGEVRGLLCSTCNAALGGFLDSVEVLKSAIRYLEESSGTESG